MSSHFKTIYFLVISIVFFGLSLLLCALQVQDKNEEPSASNQIQELVDKIALNPSEDQWKEINGLRIETKVGLKSSIIKDYSAEYLCCDNHIFQIDTTVVETDTSNYHISLLINRPGTNQLAIAPTKQRIGDFITLQKTKDQIVYESTDRKGTIYSKNTRSLAVIFGLFFFLMWAINSKLKYLLIAISLATLLALTIQFFNWSDFSLNQYHILSFSLYTFGLAFFCLKYVRETSIYLFHVQSLITFFGIAILVYLVFNNNPTLIDIHSIVATGSGGLFFILSIFLLVLSKFYSDYRIYKQATKSESSKNKRVLIAVLFSIIILITAIIFPLIFVLYCFVAYFTYSILLDIFSENRPFSITWVSIWLTFFCVLVSLILFKSHLNVEKNVSHNNLINLEASLSDYSSFEYLDNGYFDFDFAIYQNKTLQYSKGFFPKEIEKPVNTWTESISGKTVYTIYNKEEKVLVTKQEYQHLIKPLSLFSYLFLISGIFILLLLIINNYYHFLPKIFNYDFDSSSLKSRIQISVIGLIILSFIGIGFISTYYFDQLSKSNYNSRLQHKVLSLEKKIDQVFEKLAQDTTATLTGLMNIIPHSDELNYRVFNKSKLVYSTLSFDQNNLNKYYLENGFQTSIESKTHNFSNGKYNAYVLSNSVRTNQFSAWDFLSAMLNIYIFLFLIALTIAIAVANSITRPISILGEKLGAIKLSKTNERIEWKSQDELGELITEYNSMLDQIEQGALVMAKSERDSAWREMAQQVAHEIKNPLTPMKLSIQYLERSVSKSPERAPELIKRVSNTLIEQIDNLSQIAGEFSNFGALPKAKNDRLILNEVVEAVHDLFRKRSDIQVILQEPIDDIIVFADKNHMIRILNNLVKNAIQAIPEDKPGKVLLKLYKKGNLGVVKVSDNGTGIPEDMQGKVFTPNFTTKSSGTGLGLAISSNMIEACNGRIFFETEIDKGTDFYIELPLMRIVGNSDKLRVSLD